MNEAFDQYRFLESKLRELRQRGGVGTALESPLIEAMVELWDKLTDAERDLLDAEGPMTFPDPSR